MKPNLAVRWRDDLGYEGQCGMCMEWLPLSSEFFGKRWLTRCRVCIRAYKAASETGRRYTKRDVINAKKREYRALNHAEHIAKQRRYREEHREQVNEWARRWREANRERINEQARIYYQETKDVQRIKKAMRRRGELETAA